MLNKPGSDNQECHVHARTALHPAVLVYLWMSLAVAAQVLHGAALGLLAGVVFISAIRICASHFFILMRRTRWILVSIIFIYAYTGEGEAVLPQWGMFSPLAAGLQEGIMQLLRLLIVLAGVAMLIASLSQAQLIGGLYTLCYPFSLAGLQRDRIAVRLALTLHYAESVMLDKSVTWHQRLEQLMRPGNISTVAVGLPVNPVTRRDWLLMALSSVVLAGLWL